MKYIIFQKTDGTDALRVADEGTEHIHLWEEIGRRNINGIVSAGKVYLREDKELIVLHGSVGLGIKYNEQERQNDEVMLKDFFQFRI